MEEAWRLRCFTPGRYSREMGNLAFTVTFESFSACGTCYDAMMGDADFRKWQADAIKGGLIEWVGGNAARKVAID